MAVNDFWRRFSGELNPGEEYISPTLLETALIDISTNDPGGITMAQTRAMFDVPVGTDAGTEFGDFITSMQTLPGTNGFSGTKLVLQERVLNRVIRFAILGSRQTLIPNNPYASGNALRLAVRALITARGGTPQGTLAAA